MVTYVTRTSDMCYPMSMSMSKIFIGGAVCREFESEEPDMYSCHSKCSLTPEMLTSERTVESSSSIVVSGSVSNNSVTKTARCTMFVFCKKYIIFLLLCLAELTALCVCDVCFSVVAFELDALG